jgi:hypothetical protein
MMTNETTFAKQGKDGAFSEFKVLFADFNAYYGEDTLKPALEKKGFTITTTTKDGNAFERFLELVERSNAAAADSRDRFANSLRAV